MFMTGQGAEFAAAEISGPSTHGESHADLVAGLLATPAGVSPKYFYDARGSELFTDITSLPEYYPTRTEQHIMQTHGTAMAQQLGPVGTVIEWGAGNCAKACQLCALLAPERFVALDISVDCLEAGAQQLQARCPAVEVQALAADLTADLALPIDLPMERRLVFYPGSSIGNFDPAQALLLLQRMRAMLGDDGALLIGIDLVKPVDVLEAAYNDAAGVTAAFNLNLLRHANRLIGSNFDERDWAHHAFFNAEHSRIEMHLQALRDVVVHWPGHTRSFAKGETIHTENSHKFELGRFKTTLAQAGFSQVQPWTDERGWYAIVLAKP